MTKFYTARYDRVFKTIICNEENPIYLKKILESILKEEIEEIKILKNELPINNISERLKIVDLLVKINQKYVHVELNPKCEEEIKYRNYIYFSNIISSKTKRGEGYDKEERFIHIDLTYEMQDDTEIKNYYIQNEEQIRYVDNIQIVEINMDKITKLCYSKNEYKYLGMLDLEPKELKKIAKGDEIVEKYEKEVEELNKDEKFQSWMTQEEQAQMMFNTYQKKALKEGFEQGREQGFEQGIEQGIEKGIEQGERNAVKKMVGKLYQTGIELGIISKTTGLSEEEIISIIKKDE